MLLIAPDDCGLEKNINALKQIKGRNGKVIAINSEAERRLPGWTTHDFVPRCPEFFIPLLPLCRCSYLLTIWPCILIVMSINRVSGQEAERVE